MKIFSEHTTARSSSLGALPLLALNAPGYRNAKRSALLPSAVLQELPALKGAMFSMRRVVKTAIALSWVVSASVWAAGSYVYDAAGEVTAAVGKNAAQRIAINDAIVPNTMISTGDKSYVVLKFDDGQVVTLQANSTFQVRKYKYDPKRIDQSSAVFSMFKGGMRFITGLIGQRNKKAFRLATPNMTIGVRGTEFMVAIVNGATYSQVISGGIRLTNDAGTAVFTAGQTAAIPSARSLPTVISAADLPAGTFGQLVAIATPSAAPVNAPSVAAGAVSNAVAATTATTATGSSSATGLATETSASEAPVAVPAAVQITSAASVTSAPSQNDSNDPFRLREPDDLATFKPSSGPPVPAASDAALTAATSAAGTAPGISRDEAAAGLFGKHNFTATGIATGEICAFCHAPQGAETKVAAPLWNRSLSPLSSYQAYSTLGSATAAAAGSVSMACLSCHDGTQAPNIVINTPGKSGVESDSAQVDGSLFLKGHHPVGMPYGGGGPSQAMPGAPFKLDDFSTAAYSGSGSGTVWWIDTGGNGRQKSDLLLFSRADMPSNTDMPNNGSASRPYVECASCHDPHKISTPTFLRVANTVGSALCLTCHAK